jgi:hypothetical protein
MFDCYEPIFLRELPDKSDPRGVRAEKYSDPHDVQGMQQQKFLTNET